MAGYSEAQIYSKSCNCMASFLSQTQIQSFHFNLGGTSA